MRSATRSVRCIGEFEKIMRFYPPNDLASRIVLTDATLREIDVCHFHGSGLMTINLQRCSEKEIRADGRLAAELAYIGDHFSRHKSLPSPVPQIEYHI